MASPCPCGNASCTCLVVDADGNSIQGNGSSATPYKLPAVGTADTCSIIWTPGRTGTAANPLEGNVPLDPAGNITCGPDGMHSPPLCDEIDGLVSQPAALTDEIVATDGTNCFTVPVSSLPAPVPDPCAVMQDYFDPIPPAPDPNEIGAIPLLLPDGAGGFDCSYAQSNIAVNTPIWGGSGSPPSPDTIVGLQPAGPTLVFQAGCGFDVYTVDPVGQPGAIIGSARTSNVPWSYPGSPAVNGSPVFCDATNRRIYGDAPHARIDGSSLRIHPTFLKNTAGGFTPTDAAQIINIANPSATRDMRVAVTTWHSGVVAQTPLATGAYTIRFRLTAAGVLASTFLQFPQVVKDSTMPGTTQRNNSDRSGIAWITIAPGAIATLTLQAEAFLTTGASVTLSPAGNTFRYGLAWDGATL